MGSTEGLTGEIFIENFPVENICFMYETGYKYGFYKKGN
jgi:hypothetical protein